MEYGICNLAVIPMRAEPSDRSEMVSQVLFGEAFEILEWRDKWVQITTAFDNYTGWIDRLQVIMLGHLAYKRLLQAPSPVTCRAVTQAWKIIDNTVIYLPAGSSLAFLEGTTSYIADQRYDIIGEIGETHNLATTATSFLNTPYLWGGRTHFGIDCSGFTQVVYKMHGISIKRDASLQAQEGTVVDSVLKARLGDLAFFNNDEGRITHVGIILGAGQIIHASGKVKIDVIDTQGIYSEELKRYTHRLKTIRRYL